MTTKLNVGLFGMEQLKKYKKKWFKKDSIKELVHSFCSSIPVIKLSMLDEDIREYLLYSLLSMQYVMGKQPALLDALFTQTESNENWT